MDKSSLPVFPESPPEGLVGYDKFVDKAKNEPFVPLGILGTLAVATYGIYNYRNRGSMSLSMYLMGLRVRSQAVVVGAMTVGIAYQIVRDYVFVKPNPGSSK